MSAPSWMLLRLALDTRTHHAQADSDRLLLMDAESRTDYRAYLARVYGLEVAIEDELGRIRGLPDGLLAPRLKAERLHQDLEALGMRPFEFELLPRCTNIRMRSPGQALGWLFVIERHTLLAGLIRRHLARVMPDEIRDASSYLSAYTSPGALLRSLGDALGRFVAEHQVQPSTVVAAAAEAFRVQRQWYLSWSGFGRIRFGRGEASALRTTGTR